MINGAIDELFLRTYFIFDAIGGKLIKNKKFLYDKLSEAFELKFTGNKTFEFQDIECEEVRNVNTYGKFMQKCRIKEYCEITGLTDNTDSKIYNVIKAKGSALYLIKKIGLGDIADITESELYKKILSKANTGNIPALYILGFLQYEGICEAKNELAGKENFEKAASWNSIEGILLAMKYDKSCFSNNVTRLRIVTRNTPYRRLAEYFEQVDDIFLSQYDERIDFGGERLLQKAFEKGVLNPELRSPQIARIVYNDYMNFEDKRGILFSQNKEVISDAADLPAYREKCGVDYNSAGFENFALNRAKETETILKITSFAQQRYLPNYRPLCLASESEFLLKLYAEELNNIFTNANIERIDMSELNCGDLDPTKNNIFVRRCRDWEVNVYEIFIKKDTDENALIAVQNFLQSDKRRKTRLLHPSITLDLSDIIPICFCDKSYVKFLAPYCSVVTLENLNCVEKSEMLDLLLKNRVQAYLMDDVSLDENAREMLLKHSIEKAEILLDKAFMFGGRQKSLKITSEAFKELLNENNKSFSKCGFGEINYEN